jgi:hypothetical protein
MSTSPVQKLTANLFVDQIEPCLPFWTERLGFTKTAEVPEGDRLGFVILTKDDIELMYQSWDSLEKDVPGAFPRSSGRSVGLFIIVNDLDAVERAMDGVERVFPRRRTFYGMDEIGVREPGGHVVTFGQPAT